MMMENRFLRILYTIDAGQHILARSLTPVEITLITDADGAPRFGSLSLKRCLSTVCQSRPEIYQALSQNGTRDFSVSLLDPLEADTAEEQLNMSDNGDGARAPASQGRGVMVGMGLMSWSLESEESEAAVVNGTLTKLHGKLGPPALEIVLALRETTRMSKSFLSDDSKTLSKQPSSWSDFILKSPLATRAPSSVAQNPGSTQMMESVRILNDRPSSEKGIAPVALLYPPFGRFIDIFNGTDDVTEIDEDALRARVEKFATAGRKYYSDDFARRTAMLPILNEIFDTHMDGKLWPPILESTVGSLNRVGTYGHSDGEFGATDVMMVWKNAMLTITSEAEYEGVAYITQSHTKATSKYSDVYAANRMPVLLMTVQGPHICFLAILILHRPRVVELTPMLGLRHDGANVSALDTLCRAFRAACILRAEIRKDMAMMVHQSRPRLLHPEFPSIDKCLSYPPGNQHISFKLVDRFESLDDRLLFTAQMGSAMVLVKFTRSYSPALHIFCHNLGHAPQLLGYQELPGGWFIVVMEFLEGWMHLSSLQLSDTQRFAAWEQIRALADAFHEEGFVHGDLRTANILAPPGWDSTPTLPTLSVVDYDWGGVCGTARYPTPQLTSELLTRPRHTLGDLIIMKEDDLQVLFRTLYLPQT